MVQLQLLILALLPISSLGMSQVGCYSSLPSSYSDKSTYQYQSSSHCSDECSGYSYFALQGGNTCICGNDAPSGSKSSDCNTPCFGYGEEMCGGSNAYMIFSTGNGGGNSGSSSNAQSSTSSSNTGTSSTSNTQTSSSTTSSNTQTSKTSTTSSKETQVTQSVSGSTVVVMSTVAVSATPTSSASESQTQSASSTSPSSSSSSSSSGSSKPSKKTNLIGPVVGGVVGGVGLIALVSVLFFFLRRRSSKSRDAELADSAYYDAIKRDNSTVARPLSNPFLSKEEFTDQRLNPVMLGRRRISEGSLADEADYSRKILRVANPDDDL